MHKILFIIAIFFLSSCQKEPTPIQEEDSPSLIQANQRPQVAILPSLEEF